MQVQRNVLSKMAFLSLTSGKIIFKEEDFKDWNIENVENIFEISGLITKIEGGDFDVLGCYPYLLSL